MPKTKKYKFKKPKLKILFTGWYGEMKIYERPTKVIHIKNYYIYKSRKNDNDLPF